MYRSLIIFAIISEITLCLLANKALAEDPKIVLVENIDLSGGDTRLHYPTLIANQRGYRLRCASQADEESMIRGLGFLSAPADVLTAVDPEIIAAAPLDNPLLCPSADNYVIKVFAFSDETGLNHYLQFPTGLGSTSYTNKIYRPGCAGLAEALKVDLEGATNADPRPFFGADIYDIQCLNGTPIESRPETFAAWCTKTDLTEAEAKTVDAVLESTPGGAAARGNPVACANAQSFLTAIISMNLAGLELTTLEPLSVLPNLVNLTLSSNQLVDIGPLAALKNLIFLDLSGNTIDNLSPLSLMVGLLEVDLADNAIGNLRPLSSNLALTRLDLANNQIADVSPLRFLQALRMLDLAGNQLTGAAVEPLSGLGVLERLDLSDNQIESIETLSQFAGSTEILLAGNPVVGDTSLNFAETCVLHRADATPFGFTIRAMLTQAGVQNCDDAANALNSSPSLDLSSKMISDVRPVALVSNLTSLNLSANAIVDVEPLASMAGLSTLNLSTNNIVKVDGLAKLANLTALDLSGNPVDTSQFLAACLVRDHEGILTDAQSAETAILVTFAGEDKCLAAAETLQRSTTVTLQNVGLQTLDYFSVFENAHRLNLRQNALIDVEPLKALPRLTTLNLSENQLTSLAGLTTLIELESLNVSGNPINSLNGIQVLQRLRSLLIGNTQIASVRLLASLPLLEQAQLGGLNISYGGFEDYCLVHKLDSVALLEARPFMLAIEPRLAADGIDPANCDAMANWARNIEVLNLNKANLSSIEPVRFFTDLSDLRLFDNRIRDAGPVRNLLRLETLNLSQNLIEAIPLLQSSVIRNLTINQNRIEHVQTLQSKTSLVILRLDNNRIRDARPLNNLTNLTYLDLRSNLLATGEAVNGLFPRNPYLKGNPVCQGPFILIFPPPPIVEACTREPNFGWVLQPGITDHVIIENNILPHVINPNVFRPFQ